MFKMKPWWKENLKCCTEQINRTFQCFFLSHLLWCPVIMYSILLEMDHRFYKFLMLIWWCFRFLHLFHCLFIKSFTMKICHILRHPQRCFLFSHCTFNVKINWNFEIKQILNRLSNSQKITVTLFGQNRISDVFGRAHGEHKVDIKNA